MRKRLRKKKFLGEFRVYGAKVRCDLVDIDTTHDIWLDSLIDCIEANGCFVGGGCSNEDFEGFVEIGMGAERATRRLDAINHWLEQSANVRNVRIGNMVDANYGDFDD